MLFFVKKRKTSSTLTREQIKQSNDKYDLGSIVSDFGKVEEAKKMLFILKRSVHPDRFIGDEAKIKVATELSMEVNDERNKLSYSQLNDLKKRAELELGIIINY